MEIDHSGQNSDSNIQDQQVQFNIDQVKHKNEEITELCWSNFMDLLAFVSGEYNIELHRISFKHQKVFQIKESKPIKGICFSPDSQMLLYATVDSNAQIHIVKTENGERVFSIDKIYKGQLESLNWVQFYDFKKDKHLTFLPNNKENEQLYKYLVPIAPHQKTERKNLMKLYYLFDIYKNIHFNALLGIDKSGDFSISINAMFPLVKLNVKTLLYQEKLGECNTAKSLSINNFEKLHLTVLGKQHQNLNQSIYIVQLDTSIIKNNKAEFGKIAYVINNLECLLSFLKNSIETIQAQIKQIILKFEIKMEMVEEYIKKQQQLQFSENNEQPTVNSEFLRFLVSGIYSQALAEFMRQEVIDQKLLTVIEENMTEFFNNLNELVRDSAINVLQRILLNLSQLESFVHQNVAQQQKIGFDIQILNKMTSLTNSLYQQLHNLLDTASEQRLNIRCLLVWLNKNALKSVQEQDQEIENQKTVLNKYQVEVPRLYEFLKSDYCFQLKPLEKFIKIQEQQVPQKSYKNEDKENQKVRNSTMEVEDEILEKNKNNFQIDQPFQSNLKIPECAKKLNLKKIDKLQTPIDQIDSNYNQDILLTQVQSFEKLLNQFSSKIQSKLMKEIMIYDIILKIGDYEGSPVMYQQPQSQVQDSYIICIQGKVQGKQMLQILEISKKDKENIHIKCYFIEIQQNHSIKDLSFSEDQSIVVILNLKKEKQCVIGVINTSQLKISKEIQIQDSKKNHIMKDSIINSIKPSEIYFNQLNLLKSVVLNSNNCQQLSSNLKGLYSLVQDTNKLLILD